MELDIASSSIFCVRPARKTSNGPKHGKSNKFTCRQK